MKSDLYEDASQKVAELAGDLESSIRQAIKDLTTTPQGREFLWWLLEITTLKVEMFYGNSGRIFRREALRWPGDRAPAGGCKPRGLCVHD